MGPNVGEAINFLTDIQSWKKMGLKWKHCSCQAVGAVKLGLEIFLEKEESELFKK